MSKKLQIISVFVCLIFLFCFTSCANILNEIFGLERINIEDKLFDSFAVYRINDSYSYIDFAIPEESPNVDISVCQVKYYSDGYHAESFYKAPGLYYENDYYDGWVLVYNEKWSEIITSDKYKKINSLKYSYNSYNNETTFSWDLGELPSLAKSFAISNYEYSESYSLYSILVDSIDSSLNSVTVSGNYTNNKYYFYFEYDDGYYYCLGKFE